MEEDSNLRISLIPSSSDARNVSPTTFQMGVFDWIGTNAGVLPLDKSWVDPVSSSLVTLATFSANSVSIVDSQPGNDVFGIQAQHTPINQSATVVSEGIVDVIDLANGMTGHRLTVDIGLQLIPTAYRLFDLCRIGENNEVVRVNNWCLQVSAIHGHTLAGLYEKVYMFNCNWYTLN